MMIRPIGYKPPVHGPMASAKDKAFDAQLKERQMLAFAGHSRPRASHPASPLLAGSNRPVVGQERAQARQISAMAHGILADMIRGKSIDLIAREHGLDRARVLERLDAAGLQVEASENGIGRTTVIADPTTGKTVTETHDVEKGNYTIDAKGPDGKEASSPIRSESGRKQTSSRDPKTGAVTTRYENDLGDGTVVEQTRLPSGVEVEKTIPKHGKTETRVKAADGAMTPLAPDQEPTRDGVRPVTRDIAEGKTIDEIARAHGWTSKQVIAQLAAVGFEVRTREPSGSNGYEKGPEVVDDTGKVFAGHYANNGARRTYYVDTKGNEVSRTEHRNGDVSETKIDPEGRKTEKTTENGRTTVKVTFNGYTLTTAPNGGMTLTDNSNGGELKIKPGSVQTALAKTLLAVNPNGSDPAEAKEGKVVKAAIEGMLAGERLPELVEAARKRAKDAQRLIDKYDLGPPAAATFDGPFGGLPLANAPSGGKWVPVQIDNKGFRWVDPAVAKAIVAGQAASARVAEAQAKINQSHARLDAYVLDPAYKRATDGAQAAINKALAPHGLQWTPRKPTGTSSDARSRLEAADSNFDKASGARGEYEAAARVLDTAIPRLNRLQPLPDPDGQSFVRRGSPSVPRELEHARGLAAHAEVKALLTQVGLHLRKGDMLSVDYLVGPGAATAPKGTLPDGAQPVAITVAGRTIKVAPEVAEHFEKSGIAALAKGGKAVAIEIEVTKEDGSKGTEWRWFDPRQALVRIEAASQLELAQANHASYRASSRAVGLDARKEDLKQKLFAEYNRNNPTLLEPGKKHSRINQEYLGLLRRQELQIRDGQLWVVNHFEEGTTEEQLTYGPDDENVRAEYRGRALNKEWQKLYTEADPSQCTIGLLPGAKAAQAQAGRHLTDVMARQQRGVVADLDKGLNRLRGGYAAAVDKYGLGSVDAPKGTLPDGVQAVEIAVGEHNIKVAPEVAEQYRSLGADALTRSDKAVWIEIPKEDGSGKDGRWVDPHVAVQRLQLDATELQRQASDGLRRQAEGFRDWYDMRLSRPQLLADENQGLDKAYLDGDKQDQQKALDGIYQSKFQSLLAAGYGNQFKPLSSSALDETVTRTLGFDTGTDAGREARKTVTDEIRGIGGDTPQVRLVPIFHVDDTAGAQQTALIAVRDGQGKTWYVDATGQKFENIGDFQDNNRQFDESGKLVAPVGLQMTAGADGKIALDVLQARKVSALEKWADPIVGIGTAIATVASFTPAAPIAAPLAYAGGAYLGGRALYMQKDYIEHGGEWGDKESLMNIGMVGTSALPLAAAGLRTAGLAARTELSAGQAMKGGFGAIRTKDASLGVGKARMNLPKTSYADDVEGYLRSGGKLNATARGMDATAMAAGVPLMGESAYQLAVHGDKMSALQLAASVVGLGTGFAGTGLGARSLRMSRSATAGPAEAHSPNQQRSLLQRLLGRGGSDGKKAPEIDEAAFDMARESAAAHLPEEAPLNERFDAAKREGYRFGVSTEPGDPITGSRSSIDPENKVITIDRRYASDPVKFLRSLVTQLSRVPHLPYGRGGRPPSELVHGITSDPRRSRTEHSRDVLYRGDTLASNRFFKDGISSPGEGPLTEKAAYMYSQGHGGNPGARPASELPWIARQFAGGTASEEHSGYVYVFRNPTNRDPNVVGFKINDVVRDHNLDPNAVDRWTVRLPFEHEHMLSQIPAQYIIGRRRVENGRFVGEFEYNPNAVWRIDVGGGRHEIVEEVRGSFPASPDAVFVPQKTGHTDRLARDEFTHELVLDRETETYFIQPIVREASE